MQPTSGNEEEQRDDFAAANQEMESITQNRGFVSAPLDRVLQFQISEESDARIHLRGRANRLAIKKLIALLELSVETFPAS